MPTELRKRLEFFAEHRKRSLNAEILATLEEVERLRSERDMAKSDLAQTARQLEASYKRELDGRAELTKETEALKIAVQAQRDAMAGDRLVLRALADFVLLRHKHPEVMAPMEESMLQMASAVKSAGPDASLMEATQPALLDYVKKLTAAVEEVTEILGPGWAAPGKAKSAPTAAPDSAEPRAEGVRRYIDSQGREVEEGPSYYSVKLDKLPESMRAKRKSADVHQFKPKKPKKPEDPKN